MTKTLAVVLKADPQIGTGHLMRVKALLPYLIEEGFTPNLVSDSLDPKLEGLCSEYQTICRVKTAVQLPEAVLSLKPKLVLFDHYFVDAACETPLFKRTKVAVIDDLANRTHCCHLLCDQGLTRQASDYHKLVNPEALLCIGPQYAMVKKAFTEVKRSPHQGKPRLLINFGGADPKGALLTALTALNEVKAQDQFALTILAGLANPQTADIEKLTYAMGGEFLRHVSDVPALFARIDLALGANGGMYLERIASKIPSICVSVADNQEGGPQAVEALGLGLAYPFNELADGTKLLTRLCELKHRAPEIAKRCGKLIDGQGLKRQALAICSLLN